MSKELAKYAVKTVINLATADGGSVTLRVVGYLVAFGAEKTATPCWTSAGALLNDPLLISGSQVRALVRPQLIAR
jgi:hypothetical protein